MTIPLYRDDSYLKTCDAHVVAISEQGIACDKTVFYAHGGGQLGDTGTLVANNGEFIISNTVKDKDSGVHWHQVASAEGLNVGDKVELQLDWDRRYSLMRFHSCLHMMCVVIDAPVNGGSIQVDRARLDFDLREPLDKGEITEKLMALVKKDAPMSTRWITDAELAAQPELVRTMSVKPPTNPEGTIRLVEFAGVDLQACGGTHVASTSEIGDVIVRKIENKGKQNRRITVVFD
jgi:misacylated tRNA(Ala) deacylase